MRKVAVFTGTRAEYGLLYWLMKDIQRSEDLQLQLIVSGGHLSPEFGLTYQEIENDGFAIDEKVEILLSSDTPVGVAKSMGLGVIGFSASLERLRPDLLVVLGDRFEALAIVQVAHIMRVPVMHVHGGELTEGAYDDALRHAITKLSSFHCTASEIYRNRVIQMGEEPAKVFMVGAMGLEHIRRTPLMSLQDLSDAINFELTKNFLLVTYHPETLAAEPVEKVCMELFEALKQFRDYKILITHPNSDDGGHKIIELIEIFTASEKNVCSVISLGQKRYLSAASHATAVVGNSSSGIIEAPSLNVPTVNIGNRQKGRLAAQSVINVGNNRAEIEAGIRKAINLKSTIDKKIFDNPYMIEDASRKVVDLIRKVDLGTVKHFYDRQ